MLIKFIFASFLLACLPGPDIVFVAAQSISRGAKAAIAVTCGLCSGLFIHTAAVALGIAAVVAACPSLMTGIKIFGTGYLFWLGILSVKGAVLKNKSAAVSALAETSVKDVWGLYRQGIIMNLFNPKVILFFLSFLPAFVPQGKGGLYIIFLGFCFACISFTVFGAVSLFGGALNGVLDIGRGTKSKTAAFITAFIYWIIAFWILFG